MSTDRPLFSLDAAEDALLEFYDLVPAAELLDSAADAEEPSVAVLTEPDAASERAIALVASRLGGVVIEN